ncbi:MAG: ABC transporter substrate-binding protein [Chloroflexota bacterium]|nr:ABC transporter substrate-binding protein [Chloroflexota bacterium]
MLFPARNFRSLVRGSARALTARAPLLVGTLLLVMACAPASAPAAPTSAPAAGPAPTAAPQVRTDAPVRVKVGQVPALLSAPLFIAQEKGYFREAGLEVELVDIWQASDMLTGLASGDIQIGTGGIGPALMNAVGRGLDIRIVAPLHTERPPVATPLVVRKALWDSGEVRSVADLRGRRVSLNSKASATEYWLHASLATGGLTPDDVDVQVLSFPDAVVAMANGALDAGLVGEPVATLAERDGTIVRLAEDFVDDFQVTAVYYTGAFADSQRAAGEAFLAAFLRAAGDLEGSGYRSPENLAILEKYTKVPADVIAAGRVPYHDPQGRIHVEDFQQLHDFFMQQGALTLTQPLDISTLVDPSFAEAARRIAATPTAGR